MNVKIIPNQHFNITYKNESKYKIAITEGTLLKCVVIFNQDIHRYIIIPTPSLIDDKCFPKCDYRYLKHFLREFDELVSFLNPIILQREELRSLYINNKFLALVRYKNLIDDHELTSIIECTCEKARVT